MIRIRFSSLALLGTLLLLTGISTFAQSRDVNFPTPLRTGELSGTIAARDIGDSRATSYFYTFEGGQGDIFINLVTKNFAGDVDVFTADGLRPLAKMVVFANADESETGRLIYLRKPEKLILRVEGRTPNDDPATFRIKFGGSFIASSDTAVENTPTIAGTNPNEPGVKVNTVGTIVAVIPKPEPPKPEPIAKKADTVGRSGRPPVKSVDPPVKQAETAPTEKAAKTAPAKKPGPPPKKVETAKAPPRAKAAPVKKAATAQSKTGKTAKPTPPAATAKTPTEPAPDPMANVRLVIELKDGTTQWLPMTEVQRFGFDKGVLTVVGKDGSVTRYPILDVAKVTMQ